MQNLSQAAARLPLRRFLLMLLEQERFGPGKRRAGCERLMLQPTSAKPWFDGRFNANVSLYKGDFHP
jgi:hypothetical protein